MAHYPACEVFLGALAGWGVDPASGKLDWVGGGAGCGDVIGPPPAGLFLYGVGAAGCPCLRGCSEWFPSTRVRRLRFELRARCLELF